MNVTLSANEDLVRQAREVARRQGKSLNQLFRDYLTALVAQAGAEDAPRELFDLMDRGGGSLGGARIRRDELHER